MFERFTNRARHVVVLAQEEARLLNHNYIGTEHILLGLLGEPESIGGKVLGEFGITQDIGREDVLQRVGRGKSLQSGHIPFTPRAKKTLELSLREALSLGHNYIGTEHILLGLIREGEGVAYQILADRTDLGSLREAVIRAVPLVPPAEDETPDETNAVLRWLRSRLTRHSASVPFRPETLTVEPATRGTPPVEAALKQAAQLAGPLPVGSHHLLLAALADTESAASSALSSLGVDLGELRAKLQSANVAGTSDELPQEAGRRQMAVEVSDEILTLVFTDPVIVKAGKDALRFVRADKGEAREGESGEGTAPAAGEAAGASVTSGVIRGSYPTAAGLADVWLELRKTLDTLAGATPPASPRRTRVARHVSSSKLLAESATDDPATDDPGEAAAP
jgi:ATP-dependent Clp protease ATP-binding subunit ClpC